jgi:ribose/xylose/arabinose/galactoside ABC-type transport system permease subunit
MATLQKLPGASLPPQARYRQGTTSLFESGRKFLRQFLFSEYFILYISIGYFLILALRIDTIYQPLNITNMLSNVWPLLAIATGQTIVLLIGGIDLSQTSIMAITSVAGAVIMTNKVDPVLFQKSPLWGTVLSENGGLLGGYQYAWVVAVLVMLAIGTLIGMLNGIAVYRFNMPPFMVTLVSMSFFSALAIYLVKTENVRNLPEAYINLGKGDIISIYLGEKVKDLSRRDVLSFITYPAVIAAALAFVVSVILTKTAFGRQVYAVGTNLRAARVSGVPTGRVVIAVYMISGFCAAVAGILYSARLEGGRPTLGDNMLLNVIGATVIGGTSLFGGKGKIKWTFFGVIFFVLLENSLTKMNLSAFYIDIVKGSIILMAALVDVTRTRLLAQER